MDICIFFEDNISLWLSLILYYDKNNVFHINAFSVEMTMNESLIIISVLSLKLMDTFLFSE